MELNSGISAIITGGASGLGEATARALASHGVKVALFDMNEDKGKALANELAAEGICVNGIGPGYFGTEFNRPLMEDAEFTAMVEGRTPVARWGDPDEIAGAAIFLCSEAASYVNGHMLMVDGGLTIKL